MGSKIRKHFGDKFNGVDITYSEEEFPLGTGGATKLALSQISQDHTFILNGDTYTEPNIALMEHLWRCEASTIVMGVHVKNAYRYGSLKIEEGSNSVIGFNEKGDKKPGVINAGCYVVGKIFLDEFEGGVHLSLEKDCFPVAMKSGQLKAYISHGHFIDIGIPADYEMAVEFFTSNSKNLFNSKYRG